MSIKKCVPLIVLGHHNPLGVTTISASHYYLPTTMLENVPLQIHIYIYIADTFQISINGKTLTGTVAISLNHNYEYFFIITTYLDSDSTVWMVFCY